MRIGRVIVIPAILALGAAGSIAVGSAVPMAAANTAGVHVLAAAAPISPSLYYHACSGCTS